MESKLKALRNVFELKTYDRFGFEVDSRQVKNVPLVELYPGQKVVQFQWTAESMHRPKIEDLQAPIEVDGISYYGALAWGSAVKRGMTYGLTEDFPVRNGPMTYVEDGLRFGRWLMSSGIFGGFKGNLKIGVLPPGTILPGGHPVEDGFGYIRRSVFEKFASKQRVSLGRSRDNWTYWQRVGWEKVVDEMLPVIQDACTGISDPAKMLRAAPHSYEQKQKLFELNSEVIEHPFLAGGLNRSCQSYQARLASSVNLAGEYRVCVPTTVPDVCWPGHYGKVALDRSPIDSYGSIQAVELEPNPEEEERISKLTVVQTNISGRQIATKGCLGVIDDDCLDYDLVVCSEDIKMVSSEVGTLKEAKNLPELELEDVVVPFLMIWDGPSLVGVSAQWGHNLMGVDHDGDGMRLVDCNARPKLWWAIKCFPYQETPKLPKSKTRISQSDERAEMIGKSMANLVGMATNVAGATFMVRDRTLLAAQLGFSSEEALDRRLNFFIKAGTDGFKTKIDLMAIETEIQAMQSNLIRLFGKSAPWTQWDGSPWAFNRGLPPVIEAIIDPGVTALIVRRLPDNQEVPVRFEATQNTRYLLAYHAEPVELDEMALKNAIWPWMDGTIAEIARLVIPAIEPYWKETVPVRPLAAFKAWAPEPDSKHLDQAEMVQFWFNARISRVNFTDIKSVWAFKVAYQERIDEWLNRESIDRWTAACALWHIAHSSKGKDATGASVFMAFPEECEKIVVEKPGLSQKPVKQVILTGLGYQLPGFRAGELEHVTVCDIQTRKDGKTIVRRVICGQARGQKPPVDRALPRNLLAFIAQNGDIPDLGEYEKIVIQPIGNASWSGTLQAA